MLKDEELGADWQQAVQTALTAPAEMPEVSANRPFCSPGSLQKRVALARRVLGKSGGKMQRFIQHHSDAALHLMGRLKLLKVVRAGALRSTRLCATNTVLGDAQALGCWGVASPQRNLVPFTLSGRLLIGSGLKAGSVCCCTNHSEERKSCTPCGGQSDLRRQNRTGRQP